MMEVISGLPGRPVSGPPSSATIGAFAILHSGHAVMIDRLVQGAREAGTIPAIVTFRQHPLHTLAPERAGCEIATLHQRLEAFEAHGIGRVLLIDFTTDVSHLSPDRFVRQALVDCVRANHVMVGEDFRFGHERAGDTETLKSLGGDYGFTVEVQPLIARPDGAKISTSAIRRHLLKGEVAEAAALIGGPYALAGSIVTGTKRGRELGFPTANLRTAPNACVPEAGIYSGWLATEDAKRPGVIYVGAHESGQRTSEIHLLDFDGDLYGLDAEISFHERIRRDRQFDRVEDLVDQIAADTERARQLLAK